MFLFLLNLVLRYPQDIHHEYGSSDSYFHHSQTQLVVNEGLSPFLQILFSYFGFYPYSTSMGGTFLLGSFSELTGLNIEYSTLLLSLIFGNLAGLGFGILSHNFFRSDMSFLYGFLTYSMSTRVLGFTIWNFSRRMGLLLLLPFILLMIHKFYRKENNRFLIFLVNLIIMTCLLSLHRAGVFQLLILINIAFTYISIQIISRLILRP